MTAPVIVLADVEQAAAKAQTALDVPRWHWKFLDTTAEHAFLRTASPATVAALCAALRAIIAEAALHADRVPGVYMANLVRGILLRRGIEPGAAVTPAAEGGTRP